jgi:peptidoglycan/xylan/chitin deacetylase (PgdA/CDA1 family)
MKGSLMSDRDATPENTAGPEGTAARRRARMSRRRSPVHERAIRLRRRRGLALAVIAVVAFGLGIGVGAITAGGGARPHPSASEARALRRAAARAALTTHAEAATEAGRENTAINRTLGVTPYVRMAGTQHRELALTFDDGPGPYTPQILRILRRTHTPATFFEVGIEDRYFSASTRRIVQMGDPIGDHTYNHKSMSSLPYAAQQRELLREASDMGDAGAPFPRMFRPPYGDWDAATLRLLHHWHMLMILWSVDTDDWQLPGTSVIVRNALQGAKPGAIILMHDAGGDRAETVAALPRIIRDLRRRGYRLVTVPRLLLDNPAPKQQDVASLKGAGG